MRCLLGLLALFGVSLAVGVHAQTDTSKCATVTVTRATYADIAALQKDADCFGAAVTADKAAADALDAAAAKARSSQLYRLKKIEELKANPPLASEPDIPDNFTTAAHIKQSTAGYMPSKSPDEVGAFRFTCLGGHLAYDDPEVLPGQPGKSHLHQFVGNTGTNAFSTYKSLRASGGSTCERSTSEALNRSAYWMPAMLNGVGMVIPADWMNTYYKQLPADDPKCTQTTDPSVKGACVPLPNGLQLLGGFDFATMTGGPTDTRSRDYWSMGFDCHSKVNGSEGPSLTGFKHSIAEIVATGKCPPGSWLRAAITLPQCWDGKTVTSADHRSHANYPPQSLCDGKHLYRFPEIAMQVFFTVDEHLATWRLSSDDMAAQMMGHPVVAGSTLHADYIEAWSPVAKALWEKNCIDGHLSCSAGQLGDGREIVGMQQQGAFPVRPPIPVPARP